MGFDAPETFQAQCDAKLALGRRATHRLKELLATGEVRVIESGKIDRYGRTLAYLTVNGRDVGGVLVGEGWRELQWRAAASFALKKMRA